MRLHTGIAAALLVALPAWPQDGARDERWRQDLRFLTSELAARHPDLYTQVSPDAFRAAAEELERSIPSLRDHEVLAGMARLVALAGDAHTNLGLLQAGSGFRLYPIRLQWFADGLFVVQAAQAYGRALGKRVVRIGGATAEEAYESVAALIPHENDNWLRVISPNYLVSPEALHAQSLIQEPGVARFEFAEPDGSRFALDIAPGGGSLLPAPHLARPVFPAYLRGPALFYWFDYFEDSRTLYFKYNICQESPGLPFADFVRELMALATSRPVDRFIFDFRHNSGGSTEVIRPLLNALRGAAQEGRIRPVKGVYAVIGWPTFSSAVLNAIDLKREGVTLVGQPSGGKPSSFGEVRSLRLPNSGLTVSYSTRLFQVAGFSGAALDPDIAVELTSTDYLSERDPVLERILSLEP
jgi:hypothetical protein